MKRLATYLLAFFVAAVIGVSASGFINPLPIRTTATASEISQVSYEVIYDACSGSPNCPSYELTFVRDGRNANLATAFRLTHASGATQLGDLSRSEFDQLITMLESQKFFTLEAGYPKNTGCADCVIKKITVVRAGLPKTVVDLNRGDQIPVSLRTIEQSIEGTIGKVQWNEKDLPPKF